MQLALCRVNQVNQASESSGCYPSENVKPTGHGWLGQSPNQTIGT